MTDEKKAPPPRPPNRNPDVSIEGKAVHDLTVVWKGKDGVEHRIFIKKDESTGELGKGKLENATEAWTE